MAESLSGGSRAGAGRAALARDRGTTFVEILVSLVLIGTVVIGVLAAVRATVIGTGLGRDQSKAQQWLQSAVGVLDATAFENCDLALHPTGDNIQSTYQTAVDTLAAPPEGWQAPAAIEILPPKVWNGLDFVDFTAQGSTCVDQVQLRQQLITIEVTAPDGRIVRTLEVIKRD